MFEARLVEGVIFKQLVDGIKDLVNDLSVDCTEDELSIQCMDSSHVALVAVSLSATAFDHYRCDRNLSLGLNTGNLSKILKLMGGKDEIVLKAEDEGDTLTMMFESEASNTMADFELKLTDIDQEALAIPDTSYDCTVKMSSAEFQRIVRDMQVLGDTCKISCTKEGIRFSSDGDIGTGNVLFRAQATGEKEEEHVVIDMQEPVELNFALRYLNFFTKATSLSKTVVLSMSPDVPLVVEYPISDNNGSLRYYLAPKIEDEDEEDQ